MSCRFLEVSTTHGDILESLQFYRALGFVELTTGDVWEHPYAVVSDGRISIGLHDRDLPSPALSFVMPGLADALASSPLSRLEKTYAHTGDEQFHEAGFVSPGGLAMIMLEARTFSPPDVPDTGTSLLGYFEGYALPSRQIDADVACWESLGFVKIEDRDGPFREVTLTSETLNLLLHENGALREPSLLFTGAGLDERIAVLEQRNLEIESEPHSAQGPPAGARLRGPEGLLIRLLP